MWDRIKAFLRKNIRSSWHDLLSLLGAVLILNQVLERATPYLVSCFSRAIEFTRIYIGQALFQLAFVIVVCIFAVGLFVLRTWMRRLYAILEIAFGISASVYAANQIYGAPDPQSQARSLFATMAGIYIIIRGIDNWRYRKQS